MKVLSSQEFSRRVGISDRVSRQAFRQGQWRGHVLPVVPLPGRRGGVGGKVWGLLIDQCSPELRDMLALDAEPETSPEHSLEAPFEDWQLAVQKARLEIITPLLATRKRSRERGNRIREAADKLHDYLGGPRSFDFDTLRVWVGDFERDGFLG